MLHLNQLPFAINFPSYINKLSYGLNLTSQCIMNFQMVPQLLENTKQKTDSKTFNKSQQPIRRYLIKYFTNNFS